MWWENSQNIIKLTVTISKIEVCMSITFKVIEPADETVNVNRTIGTFRFRHKIDELYR